MERFLFRKIEAWLLILVGLVCVILAVGFGYLVLINARDGHPQNRLGQLALDFAAVPETVEKLIKNKDPRQAKRSERFGTKTGWTLAPGAKPLSKDGYLLASRISGDEDRSIVELVDLADFSVKHRWLPDVDSLLAGVPRISDLSDFQRWTPTLFHYVHPLLLENGDLIVKDHQSPLFRIDRCGKMLWREYKNLFHHSTNTDAEGDLWVPTVISPGNPDYGTHFFEDGIDEVSPVDGKVLFHRSLPDLLTEKGYEYLMFTSGNYRDDALHLNDIEVAQSSGPYWQKGDLFLSMRHVSMVMLYRPSTDQILWAKQGPWLARHDVDIINDHTIAVFNNNAYDRGNGWYIKGVNDITFYDFATGQISSPYKAAMKELDIKTLTEGLFDITSEGNVIVEEENSGRIVILGPDGRLVADFINRAKNGYVYDGGWPRYIPRAAGDRALAALAAAPACP